MGVDGNKAIVQEFYDQWSSGTIDFEGLVHPGIANHQPESEPEVGLDKFRRAVQGVMGAIPDSKWTTLRLIGEGDFVVIHNRWSGTYEEEMFRGVPTSPGEQFAVEHIHIYRISEDRLVEHWVVRDDLGMMVQMGAIATGEL
jgi:predicted ester cyclase